MPLEPKNDDADFDSEKFEQILEDNELMD